MKTDWKRSEADYFGVTYRLPELPPHEDFPLPCHLSSSWTYPISTRPAWNLVAIGEKEGNFRGWSNSFLSLPCVDCTTRPKSTCTEGVLRRSKTGICWTVVRNWCRTFLVVLSHKGFAFENQWPLHHLEALGPGAECRVLIRPKCLESIKISIIYIYRRA